MAWGVFYIFGKLLEHKCLKWACITNLDIWNTSYGQKEGRESNWQFDSWPLKVENQPDSLVCRWRVTYCWKALDEGYNFSSKFISIRRLNAKLWCPKVAGVPTLALGSLETKSHLDVGPVGSHKVYYKGEGGGFPQVRTMVSLVSPSHMWLVLAPKVFQLCTNHLVLVLCKPVWVSEACQFFLIPSHSSSTPLYPSKVLRARERAQLCVFSMFSIWDSYLSHLRSYERVNTIALLILWKEHNLHLDPSIICHKMNL
jgi:hypothetical protein